MRIILLSFLLLFNYSNHVTSCPSSGDGDCVASTVTYNKDSNKSTEQKNEGFCFQFGIRSIIERNYVGI